MARGFGSGVLLGGVICGVGLAALSVLSGPVMAPRPDARLVEPVAAKPSVPANDVLPLARPEAPSRPVPGAVAVSPGLPAAPSVAEAPGFETRSAPLPDAPAIAAAPAALDEAPDEAPPTLVSPVPTIARVPVVPAVPGPQPGTPAPETLRISTGPADPPADPPADASATDAPEGAADTDPPTQPIAPIAGAAESPGGVAAQAAAAPVASAEPENSAAAAAPDGEPDRLASAAPDATIETAPVSAAPEVGASGPLALAAPVVPALPEAWSEETRVVTDRLPAAGPEASQPVRGMLRAAGRPIETHAEPVMRVPDAPLLAIVLIDDGAQPLGLEALAAFPYPLTFAIGAARDDAAAAMARYRAAGFEVMALTDLPAAAQPSDVEVLLRGALDAVPEAVAVLEGTTSGLQGGADVSAQVVDILAESGHGLVLYPQGLNTAAAQASRAGVPTQALFRDFDAEGQDATVIRRFLDQGAFKARQEGSAIMVGRLRPETISALLLWGLQDRALRVSLVPVSMVLTETQSG